MPHQDAPDFSPPLPLGRAAQESPLLATVKALIRYVFAVPYRPLRYEPTAEQAGSSETETPMDSPCL
jgi:hypothetical protein